MLGSKLYLLMSMGKGELRGAMRRMVVWICCTLTLSLLMVKVMVRASVRLVDGFQRRSIHCGYCPPDLPTFEEQCSAADRKHFVSNHQIPITYCNTFYRLLQLPHDTTICDLESTIDNYQFTLDTSLTRTSSLACRILISISSDCLINCQ